MIFIQVLHLLKAPFLFLCEFMDPIWNNVYHVCLFRFLSYNNWLLRFLFIYLFIYSFIHSFIHYLSWLHKLCVNYCCLELWLMNRWTSQVKLQ